jgi:glucosamine--fructose-6-phosphate aminotransferase (isomerizing)
MPRSPRPAARAWWRWSTSRIRRWRKLADTVLPLHAGPETQRGGDQELPVFAGRDCCSSPHAGVATRNCSPRRCAARGDACSVGAGLVAAGVRLRLADHLFVLGRGLGLAAAQEAALKFKETCGLHAEAFSAPPR